VTTIGEPSVGKLGLMPVIVMGAAVGLFGLMMVILVSLIVLPATRIGEGRLAHGSE
jgi:hypothetical protein